MLSPPTMPSPSLKSRHAQSSSSLAAAFRASPFNSLGSNLKPLLFFLLEAYLGTCYYLGGLPWNVGLPNPVLSGSNFGCVGLSQDKPYPWRKNESTKPGRIKLNKSIHLCPSSFLLRGSPKYSSHSEPLFAQPFSKVIFPWVSFNST